MTRQGVDTLISLSESRRKFLSTPPPPLIPLSHSFDPTCPVKADQNGCGNASSPLLSLRRSTSAPHLLPKTTTRIAKATKQTSRCSSLRILHWAWIKSAGRRLSRICLRRRGQGFALLSLISTIGRLRRRQGQRISQWYSIQRAGQARIRTTQHISRGNL